jgi:hypothetical protein
MAGLRHIIGYDISLRPEGLPYAERDHQNPTLFVNPKHVDWDPEKQHTTLVNASLYPYLMRIYSYMTINSTGTTQPQSRTINSKIFYKQEE